MPPGVNRSGEHDVALGLVQSMISGLQDEVRRGFTDANARLSHIDMRLTEGAATMAQHEQRLHEISGSVRTLTDRHSAQSSQISRIRESICDDCDERVTQLEEAHRAKLVLDNERDRTAQPKSYGVVKTTIITTLVTALTNAILATVCYYLFILPQKVQALQNRQTPAMTQPAAQPRPLAPPTP